MRSTRAEAFAAGSRFGRRACPLGPSRPLASGDRTIGAGGTLRLLGATRPVRSRSSTGSVARWTFARWTVPARRPIARWTLASWTFASWTVPARRPVAVVAPRPTIAVARSGGPTGSVASIAASPGGEPGGDVGDLAPRSEQLDRGAGGSLAVANDGEDDDAVEIGVDFGLQHRADRRRSGHLGRDDTPGLLGPDGAPRPFAVIALAGQLDVESPGHRRQRYPLPGLHYTPDRHGDEATVTVGPVELTPEEIRVLGALVEKEATTPEQYPLSSNSLRLACNQSTNRDPVVDYSERDVDAVMLGLREQGLARTLHGAGHRVAKHKHALTDRWSIRGEELAVLAVLMLRGPQTEAELKARTERYPDGPSTTQDVAAVIDRLSAGDDPFVVTLPRRPGERETRFTHLLTGEPTITASALTESADPVARRDRFAEAESRISVLEETVAALQGDLAALRDALGA